jgi:hypothetical protein
MTRPTTKKLTKQVHRLSDAQRRFVYLIVEQGLTPSEAAQQCGYGRGGSRTYNAAKAASSLLGKSSIQKALRDARAAQERRPATKQELQAKLGDIEEILAEGRGTTRALAMLRTVSLQLRIMGMVEEPEAVTPEPPRAFEIEYVQTPSRGNQTSPVQASPPILEVEGQPTANSTPQRPPMASPAPVVEQCPRHGPQKMREERLSGTNQRVMVPHCESCSAEAREAERKLSSLAPGEPRWRN